MSDRTEPYNATEQVVVGYLREIMPDIGAGDDPVRFLVASHAAFRAENQRLKEAVKRAGKVLTTNYPTSYESDRERHIHALGVDDVKGDLFKALEHHPEGTP